MHFVGTFFLGISIFGSMALGYDRQRVYATASTVRPTKHRRHFKSKHELRRYLAKLVRRNRGHGYGSGTGNGDAGAPAGMSATVEVTTGGGGSGGREEQITNTQNEDVDEGSIVKLHGNYLVVLRRGRLFTIDIGKSDLRSVSMINAYGPDIDPEDTWYDEMLVSGENIAVIGYSYKRGGTEIGLFKIDENGRLAYRSTYHLRSNDYYSSRNYSSRLIGKKLIFYSPLNVDLEDKNPFNSFPALRRWHKGATNSEFRLIEPATKVYVPDGYELEPYDVTLHTVTTCNVGDELSCTAESVLGPSGDVFYVSPKNVYVWASRSYRENSKEHNRSHLFKMPLDGGNPTAVRVSGSPVDQFSFNEDDDENLNVLVRADSQGDGMWRSEVSEGEVALLRLPANDFNNGAAAASRHSYQELEEPHGNSFQNRFVGDYLLYGTMTYSADSKDTEENRMLFVLNRKTRVPSKVKLEHDVRRLDLLGRDGIVVGNSGSDLSFTSIKLDGSPRAIDSYTIKHASQSETRSQGFFYKPIDDTDGLLGLPVVRNGAFSSGRSPEAASVTFLRNSDLRFAEFGELNSSEDSSVADDACKASCVDWYGDARPIFARGRIFALLGYEIVEGTSLTSPMLQEIKRLNFAPTATAAER